MSDRTDKVWAVMTQGPLTANGPKPPWEVFEPTTDCLIAKMQFHRLVTPYQQGDVALCKRDDSGRFIIVAAFSPYFCLSSEGQKVCTFPFNEMRDTFLDAVEKWETVPVELEL